MAKPKFLSLISSGTSANISSDVKVRSRAQTIQRLQVGIAGIFVMLMVIGLAATLTQRAQSVEDEAVPDAAPTTEPEEVEAQSDPLADAGVLPEIPDETEEADAVDVPVGSDVQGNTATETEVEDTEAQ